MNELDKVLKTVGLIHAEINKNPCSEILLKEYLYNPFEKEDFKVSHLTTVQKELYKHAAKQMAQRVDREIIGYTQDKEPLYE